MAERRTFALGPAATGDEDAVLDLSPLHPSAHGGLQLAVTLDGDTVVRAEPRVGFVHRGAEKLFEARDYRQVVMLANRHDWLSAFCNELGIVLAVEQLLGVQVPPRAVWLRTALAELNRALAGLLFLGAYPLELGVEAPMQAAAAARQHLLAVMEQATGARMHYMYNRVGGLLADVPGGWEAAATGAVRAARRLVREGLDPVVLADPAFAARTVGVGVLRTEDALGHGVSGPAARASGVDLDLRRDDPYLAYPQLDVPVRLGRRGDCHDRFVDLLAQVHLALDLAEAALGALPAGPVGVPMPKSVRAPEGAIYRWTENPLGAMGYYLVSDGGRAPYRLAMRTPSFNNVSALPALLPGTRVADLTTVLASLFFVVGDLDK